MTRANECACVTSLVKVKLRVTQLVQVMLHVHMSDITIASDSARVTLLVHVIVHAHVCDFTRTCDSARVTLLVQMIVLHFV